MKKIKEIKSALGIQYRIFAETYSTTNVRFLLKWRKYFIGIPYWSTVKTNYKAIDNHAIMFDTKKQIDDFIDKVDLE